ncbi:hypothetical protein [Pseudomonas sp. PLMAX]|uniref:hypothetical protein n=1 Tax=Pseudomonas sp. PLMAX TaxID=2201998 RepID=UPI0038BC081B
MTDIQRDQAVWMLYQGYWRCVYFKWLSGTTHFFSVGRKMQATLSAERSACYTSARAGLNAALAPKDTRNQIRYILEQLVLSSRDCSCFPQNLLACRLRMLGGSQDTVSRVLSGTTPVPEAMAEVMELSDQQQVA